MKKTIGLIGRQGAGKDYSLAQLIAKLQGIKSVGIVRMAEPLKLLSAGVFEPFFDDLGLTDNLAFEKRYKEKLFHISKLHFEQVLAEHISSLLVKFESVTGYNPFKFNEHQLVALALDTFKSNLDTEGNYVVSPRLLQQMIGTNVFRKFVAEDFWSKIAQANIALMPNDLVVCPDVRFFDESQVFDHLIYIYRPQHEQLSNASHESEKLCETVHSTVIKAIEQGAGNGSAVFIEEYQINVIIFFNEGQNNLLDLISSI